MSRIQNLPSLSAHDLIVAPKTQMTMPLSMFERFFHTPAIFYRTDGLAPGKLALETKGHNVLLRLRTP